MIKEINPKELAMLGQGNTAEVYAYEADKVLKLFREGMDKAAVLREYDISKFINRQIENAPKAISFVEVGTRYGIIYEKIIGENLLEMMLASDEKTRQFAKQFVSIQENIHARKVSGYVLPTVKTKLANDIRCTTELSDDEKYKLLRYIKTLPDGNSLCHFDFHPGNIILRENTPIVIDWMTACYGDSCADVARTMLLLKYGEMINVKPEVRLSIKAIQDSVLTCYTKRYLETTGKGRADIEKWMAPVAAARLCEWLTDNEKSLLKERIAEAMGTW